MTDSQQLLERIAVALESIADSMSPKPKAAPPNFRDPKWDVTRAKVRSRMGLPKTGA